MQDGGQSTQPADKREMFKPAFRHLVSLIQERVKYPAEFDKWQKDDRADFKDMRYAVADTLCDAARKIHDPLLLPLAVAWAAWGWTLPDCAPGYIWHLPTTFCERHDIRGCVSCHVPLFGSFFKSAECCLKAFAFYGIVLWVLPPQHREAGHT